MLTGYVTSDKEAVIPVKVLGAEGLVRVEAVIDTSMKSPSSRSPSS
jgi:hypothetical protein